MEVDKMLDISREFVKQKAKLYDEKFKDSKELPVEIEIRAWLSRRPEPKYLDKEHFVKLGWWKTRRQMKNYKANNEILIQESTRSAYLASEERQKLDILTKRMKLKGVGVPVASTILHFLKPDEFPIFDVHVRSSLKKACKWNRSVKDASSDAWLEYVDIMRGISKAIEVSLRDLDKALWAYDKWG
jgi:thermostable 8-oxoguanine DNA glycosylase